MMIRKPLGGNPLISTRFPLPCLADLDAFTRQFALCLRGGDIVALIGPMGAGKTTLTQSLCQALQVTEPVSSPTFGLFHQYALPQGTLLHGDLYRLTPVELDALMPEYDAQLFDSKTITLLEWADLYPALEPFWTWRIDLAFESTHAETRYLTLTAADPSRLTSSLEGK